MKSSAVNILFVAMSMILFCGTSQALETKPVPPNLLKGNTLYAPEFNLSIDAPGPEWSWSMTEEPVDQGPNGYRTFFCQQDDDPSKFIVGVFNPYWAPQTQASVEEFNEGVWSGFLAAGFERGETIITSSNIPMQGCFRSYLTAKSPLSGGIIHMYGYQVVNNRLYTIQYVTTESEEPATFISFVKTFRFVSDQPTPRNIPSQINNSASGTDSSQENNTTASYKKFLYGQMRAHLIIAFILIFFVGGIGWIVNKSAGRIVVNAWNWAMVFILIAGVVAAVYRFPDMVFSQSLYDAGKVFGGTILFPLTLSLMFAFWRSRVLKKRLEQENKQ